MPLEIWRTSGGMPIYAVMFLALQRFLFAFEIANCETQTRGRINTNLLAAATLQSALSGFRRGQDQMPEEKPETKILSEYRGTMFRGAAIGPWG